MHAGSAPTTSLKVPENNGSSVFACGVTERKGWSPMQVEMESNDPLDNKNKMDHQDPLDLNLEGRGYLHQVGEEHLSST